MQLFGFEITRTSAQEREEATLQAIVPNNQEEPTTEVAAGGHYGSYLDLEASAKSEADLVTKYREMAMQPECDQAVEDIVNDAIIMDDNAYPVEIVLDDSNLSSRIKKVVRDEFNDILRLLDFGNKGYEIFRRWYVDGRSVSYTHLTLPTKA